MALNLWSEDRRSPGKSEDAGETEQQSDGGHRTAHEKDFDRILFSSAVRRLPCYTAVRECRVKRITVISWRWPSRILRAPILDPKSFVEAGLQHCLINWFAGSF